ncbi:hypothetical protein HNY73_014819 [Argiope bruennichi]|uniref:Uncharacterized protein n=1 Tax=Argiope bruennichi TaxID=94029 RepID=A0A8T0ERS6_ARGBR|nr:hypothetical protein HNY73_014819 [Argiope bruennichi]
MHGDPPPIRTNILPDLGGDFGKSKADTMSSILIAALSRQTINNFIFMHIHMRRNPLKGNINIGNQAMQKPDDVPSSAVPMPSPFRKMLNGSSAVTQNPNVSAKHSLIKKGVFLIPRELSSIPGGIKNIKEKIPTQLTQID